jgi:hypothetical protein
MHSYSERVRFTKREGKILSSASLAVALLPTDLDPSGEELRCHELARAIGELLNLRVVDGMYGLVDHSWCVITAAPEAGSDASSWDKILDVYAIGRCPQVQLIDTYPNCQHVFNPDRPESCRLYRPMPLEHITIRENVLGLMHVFLDRHFKPRIPAFDDLFVSMDKRRK